MNPLTFSPCDSGHFRKCLCILTRNSWNRTNLDCVSCEHYTSPLPTYMENPNVGMFLSSKIQLPGACISRFFRSGTVPGFWFPETRRFRPKSSKIPDIPRIFPKFGRIPNRNSHSRTPKPGPKLPESQVTRVPGPEFPDQSYLNNPSYPDPNPNPAHPNSNPSPPEPTRTQAHPNLAPKIPKPEFGRMISGIAFRNFPEFQPQIGRFREIKKPGCIWALLLAKVSVHCKTKSN